MKITENLKLLVTLLIVTLIVKTSKGQETVYTLSHKYMRGSIVVDTQEGKLYRKKSVRLQYAVGVEYVTKVFLIDRNKIIGIETENILVETEEDTVKNKIINNPVKDSIKYYVITGLVIPRE